MKRKQDVYCPLAILPIPKWPRLEEHWTDEDMAEANMVNSLMLEPPRLHPSLLAPARLKLRLAEALDLANFDKETQFPEYIQINWDSDNTCTCCERD